MTINPNAMSVNEIAAQATAAQITDGITRANGAIIQAAVNATGASGWTAIHAKLAEALRIKLTPNRTINAPTSHRYGRHASLRAEFAGTDSNGLARFVGAHI